MWAIEKKILSKSGGLTGIQPPFHNSGGVVTPPPPPLVWRPCHYLDTNVKCINADGVTITLRWLSMLSEIKISIVKYPGSVNPIFDSVNLRSQTENSKIVSLFC